MPRGNAATSVDLQGATTVFLDRNHSGQPEVLSHVKAACQGASCVVLIRPPADHVARAFEAALTSNGAVPGLPGLRPKYRQWAEPVEHAFGAERVQYRVLAPGVLPELCGVADTPEMTAEAAAALTAFRYAGPNGLGARAPRDVAALLAGFGSLSWGLSDSARATLRNVLADDLAWVEARLGAPLQDSDAPDVTVDKPRELSRMAPRWADLLRAHMADTLVPEGTQKPRELLPALNFLRYLP